MEKYSELEEKIKYRFKDAELLELALTHSSYSQGEEKKTSGNNERLEFLGDSILEHIIADHLYHLLKKEPEGRLSKLKATIVCEKALAIAANEIQLGNVLRLGMGEVRNGGRERPSILADGIEALIAAVYLDGGYEASRQVALGLLQTGIRESFVSKDYKDYKTTLQEKIQATGSNLLRYELYLEEGPPHDRTFGFRVYLDKRVLGEGMGNSKKEAQQMAARAGLETLEREQEK